MSMRVPSLPNFDLKQDNRIPPIPEETREPAPQARSKTDKKKKGPTPTTPHGNTTTKPTGCVSVSAKKSACTTLL